jgi:hypothetical protein
VFGALSMSSIAAADAKANITLNGDRGCLDAAGKTDEAASTWAALHAELVNQRLPLPPLTDTLGDLPPMAPVAESAAGVLWLWGPPGSFVERVAMNLDYVGAPMRMDRYGVQPPQDPLQRYGTAQELLDGRLDGGFLISQWRAALPARAVPDGYVFDLLLWWDNALLHALRPHLPEAGLMFALRDPRDMLLEWLAMDSPHRFGIESPEIAARWLAAVLTQIADLIEGELFPYRLLKLDDVAYTPEALAGAIGDALGKPLPALPEVAGPVLAPGRWRAYAAPLGAAFALLTPVAVRLGYSET